MIVPIWSLIVVCTEKLLWVISLLHDLQTSPQLVVLVKTSRGTPLEIDLACFIWQQQSLAQQRQDYLICDRSQKIAIRLACSVKLENDTSKHVALYPCPRTIRNQVDQSATHSLVRDENERPFPFRTQPTLLDDL